MTDSDQQAAPAAKRSIWVRLWPLYVILGGLGLALSQGWHTYLSLESLSENAVWLDQMVRDNLFLVLGAYVAIYALATAFMIPGSALTIGGGFLFPIAFGAVPLIAAGATVIGATLGASVLFFAAKTSIGSVLREKAGGFLTKMEKSFNEDAISYLFALRLIPVVPFAIANFAPALLGAKYRDFAITTFLGIIPGTLAYTWIGSAIKGTLLEGGEPDIAALASNFLPAFIALGVVALLPVAYKKLFSKKAAKVEGAA